MKTKRTMKSIAAAALALSLVAVPAAQNAAVNGGFSFGIMANAEAEPTEVSSFADLQTAFANATDGTTIKLTADIEATARLVLTTGNVTLDLNNFELKDNNSDKGAIYVSGGTLTVTDSSSAGGGKITAKDEGTSYNEANRYSMQVGGNGTLIIEKGELTGQVYAYGNSTLTINGGTISGKQYSNWGDYAVSTNGTQSKDTTVNINGGTLTGIDAGVYLPTGTCTVSGGSIKGNSAVVVRSGKLTVTGGTLTGTGTAKDGGPEYDQSSNDGCTGNGTAIAIVASGGNYGANQPVEITGGTIKSENASAVGTYIDNRGITNEDEVVKDFVSGGIFESGDGKVAFVGQVISTTTPEIEVTVTGGDKVTVIGETVINEVLAAPDSGITAVEVKQGLREITVPEGVTVTNSTSEDIVVNGVEFGANDEITVVDPENPADSFEAVPKAEATCIKDGCDVHYKLKSDNSEEYTKYILVDEVYTIADESDLVISKDEADHDYTGKEPVFTWADDFTCTASVECTRDSAHKATPECTVVPEVTTPATTEATGVRTYTATVIFNETTYTDTKTEVIAKIPVSEAEKVEAIKTAVATALSGLEGKVTNDTKVKDIADVVNAAITATGINTDGISILTTFTITTPATEEAAGTARAVVTVKDEEVKHDYPIAKLPASTDPGTDPGTTPGTDPGTTPGTDPGTTPGTDPGTTPGTDPGTTPGTDPGTTPGTDPGTTPGTDPGTTPGTDPGTTPGTDPGTTPAEKTDAEKIAEVKMIWDGSVATSGLKFSETDNGKEIIKLINSLIDQVNNSDVKAIAVSYGEPDSDNQVKYTVTLKAGDVTDTMEMTFTFAAEEKPAPAPAPVVNYYTVSFAGDYAGSGITVSSLSNTAGTTVTVNVPVGYSVTVVSGSNRIASISDGTGTFTMPEGNVTLSVTSYLGALTSGYKNAYIYSYDSEMNSITTNSVRGGMQSPEGEVTVKLGSKYAGKSVTLYNGRKSTSSKVDEAVLDSKGQATFSVKSGKNYTLVVE